VDDRLHDTLNTFNVLDARLEVVTCCDVTFQAVDVPRSEQRQDGDAGNDECTKAFLGH
jgi:hypothetical protein